MGCLYTHIIGIAPRCGSNFLYKLLSLHPDISTGRTQGEDNLLLHAGLLVRYAEATRKTWRSKWGNDQLDVAAALGSGLEKMVHPAADGRAVITKTPVTTGLQHLFELFPEHKVILLVRNGPDLAESYLRTFGGRLTDIARMWRDGARDMQNLIARYPDDPRILLLKYEDLVQQLPEAMERICAFLGIDPSKYPLREAAALGVWGSSEVSLKEGKVDWDKLYEKPEGFNPVGRAENWNKYRLAIFYSTIGTSPLLQKMYGTQKINGISKMQAGIVSIFWNQPLQMLRRFSKVLVVHKPH